MRKLLIVILYCIYTFPAHAQFAFDTSELFEHNDALSAILQLSNGNTFLFDYPKQAVFDPGGPLSITIFDKNRKKTLSKEIKSENLENTRAVLNIRVYEIGDEPVVFIEKLTKKNLALIRIIFDKDNANIIKDEVVYEIPASYNDSWNFLISKDANTDFYAIGVYKNDPKNCNRNIKVFHFDSHHNILNAAYYNSPDPAFNNLSLIGMTVDRDKRIFIVTYGSSTNAEIDGKLHVSALNVHDSLFKTQTLDFSEDFKETSAILSLNPVTKMLQMLTVTKVLTTSIYAGGKTQYMSLLVNINPDSLKVMGIKILDNKRISEYSNNIFNNDEGYHGMPHDMVMNENGSVGIVYEVNSTYTDGGSITNGLGNAGFSEITGNLVETSSNLIVKRQSYTGFGESYIGFNKRGILYINKRNNKLSSDYEDKHFSFLCIPAKNCYYIITNDIVDNIESKDNEKKFPMYINKYQRFQTLCYKLNNGIKEKSYVFGKPDKNFDGYAMHVNSANYKNQTGILATLITDYSSKKLKTRMAWVHIEKK